jgi:LuxR family maltose regulon positive regulatory protein
MRNTIPKTLRPLVRRERVLALLHDWRQRRILSVIAPAGYGKTTLVSEWLRDLAAGPDAPAVRWCSLQPNDDDPGALLAHLLGLLDDDASLAAVLRAGEMPPQQVLALAMDDLSRRPLPFLLAFDDLHLLQNPDVHRLLQSVVDSAPPNLHLVFLSRLALPLQLIRQRLSGELLEIGQPELAFDHDEFLAFARTSGLSHSTSEELTRIEQRSSGWAAALQMFALAGDHGAPAAADSLFLPDFLQHEILRHQPPDLVDALVRTAVLPHLDAAGLGAVLKIDAAPAEALLQRLLRADLLIQTLKFTDRSGIAVRLHPLLREFLLKQLSTRFSLAETDALRERAAAALAAVGDVDAALTLLDDDFAAARLLAAHTRAALLRFDVVALRRWFKRLSPAAVHSQPQIALDAAWLAICTETPDLRTRQQDASAAVRDYPADAPTPPAVRSAWQVETYVLEFVVAIENRHFAERNELYTRAAAAAHGTDSLAEAYLILLSAQMIERDRPLSERLDALERSAAIARRLGFTHTALESLLSRALLYWHNLDIPQALLGCDETIAVAELDDWQLSHLTAMMLHFRAEALYYLDRIDEARDAYRRAAALAARIHPAAPTDYWAVIGLTMCDLADGSPAAAPDDAEDERLFAIDRRRLHPNYFARTVWLRMQRDLRLGRIDRITATARHLQFKPDEDTSEMAEVHSLAVFTAFATGRADQANLDALTRYDDSLHSNGRLWFGMHTRILRILLLAQLGHTNEASTLLQGVLADVERTRSVRFLLDYPQLTPLLTRENSLFAQSLLVRMPAPDASRMHPFGLSDREVQILHMLTSSQQAKEIASVLAISVGTLHVHSQKIYHKMGVHSRVEAVRAARAVGIGNRKE